MATFIMLTRLTADGGRTLAANPERVDAVNAEIGEFGCSVLAQYATLGNYDFVTILEAPDAATVARLSVNLASRGTVDITTLPAIPRAEFVESLMSAERVDGDD
ncbi:MAG: GYD domain-containing protein [Acidimicrobiales bacterium]